MSMERGSYLHSQVWIDMVGVYIAKKYLAEPKAGGETEPSRGRKMFGLSVAGAIH